MQEPREKPKRTQKIMVCWMLLALVMTNVPAITTWKPMLTKPLQLLVPIMLASSQKDPRVVGETNPNVMGAVVSGRIGRTGRSPEDALSPTVTARTERNPSPVTDRVTNHVGDQSPTVIIDDPKRDRDDHWTQDVVSSLVHLRHPVAKSSLMTLSTKMMFVKCARTKMSLGDQFQDTELEHLVALL